MKKKCIYDVLVIGGGINGAGIAADAALRGLKVALCEKDDLASATSSSSSKLIHGGLRYLEQYQFRLVRAALREREVLLRVAPHLVSPLQFILPHQPTLRPYWLIRLGLWIYDHLGGRITLPKSKALHFADSQKDNPLDKKIQRGFCYADCWVDDARLVVANALQVKKHGGDVLLQHEVINAQRIDNLWHIEVAAKAKKLQLRARTLVNAAGPWAKHFLNRIGINSDTELRLVKGSHIVVPKLYSGEHAYILQNDDQRVIFVIPYEKKYSLIGTTDVLHNHPDDPLHVSEAEKKYLCDSVNRYFHAEVAPKQIVWSYVGVRPLQDNQQDKPSAVTRDYLLEIQSEDNLPILTVFGGKITTYRKLAEQAVDKLSHYFENLPASRTANEVLPGGDFRSDNFETFKQQLASQYPWLPQHIRLRYARAYGIATHELLNGAKQLADLGQAFSEDLYAREILYLREHEWTNNLESLLWRRTKLGLHLNESQRQQLEAWYVTHLEIRK